MFRVASWNVNSLKVRLEQVLQWLKVREIDVLLVQETKLTDDQFPKQAFLEEGYQVVYSGQKTYNGVAIISRHPMTDVSVGIPDYADEQKRVIAATVKGIRLIDLYVPNGSEVSSDKYLYKLDWLNALQSYLKKEYAMHENLLVAGDFNIAPEDKDVHDPKAWEGQVLVSEPERQAFRDILSLGFTDSYRLFNQDDKSYSWWDYRQAAFRRNLGLRIDHVLLSSALTQACRVAEIDKAPRKNERPSDHAPVWVDLELSSDLKIN